MKKNLTKCIIILALAVLITIFSMLLIETNESKNIEESKLNKEEIYKEELTEVLYGKENNIKHDESGNRVNTSEKMKEKIKIEGTVSLEIQGIEITSNNGNTVISGTVKNNGTVSEGDYLANILLLDEKQNALLEVGVYISKTEPKNETTFQTVVSTDLANAYSYTATKK